MEDKMQTNYIAAALRVLNYSRDELKQSIIRNKFNIPLNLSTETLRERLLTQITQIRDLHYARRRQIPPPPISDEDARAIFAFIENENVQLVDTVDSNERPRKPQKPEAVMKQIIKNNLPANYPYFIRASGDYRYKDDEDRRALVHRKEKFMIKITNIDEYKKYKRNILSRLADYEFIQGYPTARLIEVRFEILPLVQPAKLYRVAKYEAENCVINIIRGYIGDRANLIYTQFPHLQPSTEPVFIDDSEISAISKLLRINIQTYTELGAKLNQPWQTFGTKKQKIIPIKVSNEHATIIPARLKVSSVEYHDILNIPSDTNVVDVVRELDGKPRFYTQLIDGKLILHKSYKPLPCSPEIDTTYVFSNDQLMYKIFKHEYKLAPVSSSHLRKIASTAEHFIGRRVLSEIHPDHTEIDQNKNYIAYETSNYYMGFPSNTLMPARLEHATAPAFYICTIHNPPKSFQTFFDYLEPVEITITAPVYNYLLSTGARIDVNYVLDSVFQHISIIDFTEKFDIPDSEKKLFRNQLIGRTITGGVRETEPVRCHYENEQEKNQLIYECQTNNLPFSVEEKYKCVIANIKSAPNGLFTFHSYILGYAAIHMMEKFEELSRSYKIIAFNVDALVIDKPYVPDSHSVGIIGGWKSGPVKPYYFQMKIKKPIPRPPLDILPPILPDRPVSLQNQLTDAPAGIGKSYIHKVQPAYDQIILTPTRDLRDEHRILFPNTHTAHKYFQFTLSDETWMSLRRNNKIPREHQVIVIDEYTMFTKQQWDIILRRKGNSIIKALGDSNQICQQISGDPITIDYFRPNFVIDTIQRTPELHARHPYEFGLKLDKLRGLTVQEQIEYIRANFKTTTDIPPNVQQIIVGSHAVAYEYNAIARQTRDVIPMKKDGKIHVLPVDTPNVFWDRKKMSDTTDCLYEPAHAVTADSFQGKTVDSIAIDMMSLVRHGTLYTAMTRARTEENLIIIVK